MLFQQLLRAALGTGPELCWPTGWEAEAQRDQNWAEDLTARLSANKSLHDPGQTADFYAPLKTEVAMPPACFYSYEIENIV